MKLKLAFFIIISISAVFLTACSAPEQPVANNGSPINKPVNVDNPQTAPINGKVNGTPITAPTAKPVAETTNNAPTFAPIVQAYYDALKKKDDAGVKKIMAAEFIKITEADMKDDKATSITAYLAETDTIPDKPMEVRNEQIEGEKGVVEVKGGAYPNWTAIAFVKEGGAWKISNESPDIKNVKQSVTTTK